MKVTALSTAKASANLTRRRIVNGKDLAADMAGRVLVGRGVARKLGVGPDDAIALFALSKGGGVNTQSYTVAGTTTTLIAAADNVAVSMDLADAQALLSTDSVPQLIVFLNRTADTAAVAKALAAAPASSALHGLTVRTWDQLSPYFQQANMSYQLVLGVARFIVLIVALFSISGTLSLAVLERLREIGSLRAFGTRRVHVLFMLLFEGLFLGIIGAVVGCIAGGGLAALINAFGGNLHAAAARHVQRPANPLHARGDDIRRKWHLGSRRFRGRGPRSRDVLDTEKNRRASASTIGD